MATALSSVIRNVIARHVRIFDDDGNLANVDSLTGGLQVRDSLSNLVNSGRVFVASSIVLTLANGNSTHVLIRPDAQYAPHVTVEVNASATVTARIFEEPTTSADGTSLTPRNKNRLHSDNANTSIFQGPTVSADGTLVSEQIIPANESTVLGLNSVGEFVLDPAKEYLVEISNDSGGTADTDITVGFFEEKIAI